MIGKDILRSPFTDSSSDFTAFALQSAGVGTWEIDLVNQRVRWDSCCQELYGLAGHDEIAYDSLLACVYPDDRSLIEQTRDWSLDTRSGGHYDIRFRTIGADTGRLRWVRCQGRAYFGSDGKAYRVAGIAQDVTRVYPTRPDLADPTQLDKLAAALSELGVYRLSLVTGEIIHSTGFAYIITGNANAILSRADFFAALHPKDELLRHSALEEAARTGILLYEPRFVWSDGTVHQTRIVGTMHRDEFGKPAFITGHITEIDQSMDYRPDTEIRFQTLISAAPVAMGLFRGDNLVVETASETMYQLLNGGREIIGKPLLTALAHWEGLPFAASLQQAYATGESITLPQQVVSSWKDGQLINRYYTFYCTPMLDSQRNVYAVLATALDISEQTGAKKRLDMSENRLRSIIDQAPMAITLLKGRSMVLESANAKVFEIWGNDETILGKPLIETVPDILNQGFLEILEEVFDTGKPFFAQDVKLDLKRKSKLETAYFDLVYTPLRDASGAITGIMSMAIETTNRVLAHQAVEASEAKLNAILNAAPAAMGLYVGKDMVVSMANKTYISMIGKGPNVIGKPLRKLMPELENQSNLKNIDAVYSTGEPLEQFGTPVDIVRHGVRTRSFFNLTYSPLLDESGQVYAVLSIGFDVTQRVRERQKLEESERHYRQLSESLARQIAQTK